MDSGGGSNSSRSGSGSDVDCDSFNGPVVVSTGDPYNLDADGDGIGCEGS
jgi:hypothetical protein